MPWIDVGRFCFDLAEVVLVSRGIAADGCAREVAVTVSLRSGKEVDLGGRDAQSFLAGFAEFTASRRIGRPPPEVDYATAPVLGSGFSVGPSKAEG